MKIHTNFIGGNSIVKNQTEQAVILENELRDTTKDWFYWAFCVEGAQGKTITFHLQNSRLGYFGPAVSYDLETWHWLGSLDSPSSFTYTFGETESTVYFAHHMLYHPNRFVAFAQKKGLAIMEFCRGYKGSSVPCIQLGNGHKSVILTARHHACESTGNYVLEGVLDSLTANPLPDTTIFCVPFVDYEGVLRGDQGKSRAPHDHNRDYDFHAESLYPECAAIKAWAGINGCHYGFDFHSPWHKGGEHDRVFIVRNRADRLERFERFSSLFAGCITEEALRYRPENDYPADTAWNRFGPQFACYMSQRPENQLAFTLETTYFGTEDNQVSKQGLLELGRCFAKAVGEYMLNDELSFPV